MRRKLLAFVTAAGFVVVAWLPVALSACSIPAPEPFADLIESGELHGQDVVGFFEERHIAWFPPIPGLLTDQSAAVVVRYWGDPPSLALETHGSIEGVLGSDDCGFSGYPIGHRTFDAALEGSENHLRGAIGVVEFSQDSGGTPSPAELATLTERFGPPVELGVGIDDYIVGYALIAWRPLVAAAILAVAGIAIGRRITRVREDAPQADPVLVALGFAGVTAIAVVVEGAGAAQWFGLMAALAASIAIGYVARSTWAVLAAALFAGLLLTGNFTEPLGFDDGRLGTAVALLIVSAGAVAWTVGHWSAWPAAAGLVAGAFFLVPGALEQRGYRDPVLVWGLAGAVAIAAAAVMWWRNRLAVIGGPARPRREPAAGGVPPPTG